MRTFPHFPAFLNLSGRRAVVVGAGALAERKARALARCGAKVRRLRRLRPGALDEAVLVVSAAGPALNAKVSKLCRRLRIPANVVDEPALCDFILPAVVRRGRIVIGISTGGTSPALARHLRRRLERFLTPEDARLSGELARLRPRLLKLDIRRRRRVLSAIFHAQRGPA